MPTYTGPVPPPPGGQADAATWANWISFQILLQNMRYEDERAARAAVLDTQHAQKMAAEAACAAATTRNAEAQAAMAAALLQIHTTPPAEAPPVPWTDEQLLRQFMLALAEAGVYGGQALDQATKSRFAFRAKYPSSPSMVYVPPGSPPDMPTPEEGPGPLPTPKPPVNNV